MLKVLLIDEEGNITKIIPVKEGLHVAVADTEGKVIYDSEGHYG
jgi:hypothetical protein